jgi:iron complex outermembrane receptor protein
MNRSRTIGRVRFARSASALSLAAALAFSTSAFAQTADAAAEEDNEDIVVTGYAASLENAQRVKQDAPVIAEAFSAEDIGKLPDVSIAETLGRLPGLATQRLDGRSQVLSIRGLGPDFSTTMLNGREQVSSSDNRGVEYDQYPGELISSGLVYKTPFAGLVGQGLAGTVDLRTVRPLSRNERILSVSARYEFNEDGSLNPDSPGNGYRGTATYVDQFANDTIGLALGVAYQSSPSQIETFTAWGYPTTGTGDFIIGGAKPFVKSTDLNRLGVFGTLEFEPFEGLNSAIDVYYSDYSERQRLRGIEFPMYWSGATLSGTTVSDGLVTAGTFAPVNGVVRNDYKRKDTEVIALGWNTTYENDDLVVGLDLSYSRANRQIDDIESYSGTGYGTAAPGSTLGFTRRPNGTFGFSSSVDYGGAAIVLTDPQGWGGGNNVVQGGFINAPDTIDELFQIRGSTKLKFDSNIFDGLELGVNYSGRSKEREINQNFLTLRGPTSSLSGGAVRTAPIPANALLGSRTGLGFLGLPNQITYDPLVLIRDGVYTLVPVLNSSFSVPQNWTVEEDVWTGWARLDIDAGWVTGNIGVQYVQTDQRSTGYRIQTGSTTAFVPVVVDASYNHFLPSLNLNFRIGENTQLRFGAARTLARARMDQLNASLSPSVNITRLTSVNPLTSAFSASGGNPRLRPYISDGIDLSLEHYFDGGGYVSVAGYYKDLKDYVNPNDSFLTDFSYLIATELTPAQAAILGTPIGLTSGPTNNAEGSIRGIEATVSLPFSSFFEPLRGFGFQTSGSYTDSSVGPLNSTPAQRYTVPGLSKWVVNSTVYFERSGFEARVSHRYRSSFLAEISAISSTREFQTAKAESIFDAQIGYRFQSGALEGLSLTLQGLNLTNTPFVTYENGDPRRVRNYETYGRTYLIGAAYRF